MPLNWRTLCLALPLSAIVLSLAPSLWGDEWSPLSVNRCDLKGTFSCAATACHGGSKLDLDVGNRIGGEIELWRNVDPHARANGLMEKAEFAEILYRLGITWTIEPSGGPGSRAYLLNGTAASSDDGKADPARLALSRRQLNECMNCHNPAGVATSWTREVPPEPACRGEMPSSDGFAISCETCHGAAQHWLGNHFRNDFTRREEGFHDLKNLVVRGRLCASCHVGDESRDMNHDMIAAGHPPLRFELAAFNHALPKHWNDARERTVNGDYELRLWVAGQIANFDSGLGLLASRLERASGTDQEPLHGPWRTPAVWPEYAEFNCTACHKSLRSPTEWDEKKIHVASPTTAPLKHEGWNLAGIERLLVASGANRETQAWLSKLQTLHNDLGNLNADRLALAEVVPRVRQLRLVNSRDTDFRSIAEQQFPELFNPRLKSRRVSTRLTDLNFSQFPGKPPAGYITTWDEAAQAYGYLVAKAQNDADEQAKATGRGRVRVDVRASLRTIKAGLTDRDSRTNITAAVRTAAETSSEGIQP